MLCGVLRLCGMSRQLLKQKGRDESFPKSVSKKSIFVLRQAQHERKNFNELNP